MVFTSTQQKAICFIQMSLKVNLSHFMICLFCIAIAMTEPYVVHPSQNADHPPSHTQSGHNVASGSIPCNVAALNFPPDMQAASSSSNSSQRSATHSSHLMVNVDLEPSPRFEHLSSGGFYFDRTPPATVKVKGLIRGSPPRRDMSINIKEYQDSVLAARNHRIYAIDELSEVSGRSDLVALHERMRMEQVHEILANQERQARRDRPTSRRPVKEAKATRLVFNNLYL